MDQNEKDEYGERMERRLVLGEAWMMCNECGCKLYSFDGYKDGSRPCPKKRNGKCVYGDD